MLCVRFGFDYVGRARMTIGVAERTRALSWAVSNVKRNTMPSERNYQVEKQVQAWWRRLRTASGKRVWHVAGC